MSIQRRLIGMFVSGVAFGGIVVYLIDGATGFATPICVAYGFLAVAIPLAFWPANPSSQTTPDQEGKGND